jgi:2-phosphoglycolate phosphatase
MTAPRALLLDLDGTLLDTAPDMTRALNRLRLLEGRDALAPAIVRPHVSHGAARLVRVGFGDVAAPEFERLRQRFLELYRKELAVETRLFEGFDAVFAYLDANGLRWGVVTNKPGWLTEPLLETLGLADRAACIVSGDTLAERKPHPMPLHHAAALLDLESAECVYVGDAERDIAAGRAAGMRTAIAAWGYIPQEEQPDQWGALATLQAPVELIDWLAAAPDAAGSHGAIP